MLKTLPATPERAQQELTLQLTLTSPLMMIKGHTAPEVERAYTPAHELFQEVGESPHHFPALVGLWRFYLNQAKLWTAHALGEQCFALAQRLQDPVSLLEAHLMLGSTLLYLGELASADANLEQGITLCDPLLHRARTVGSVTDLGVVCLARASWTLWILGYPDQALKRSHESLTLAQELSHPYSLCFAWYFATALHQSRRQVQLV